MRARLLLLCPLVACGSTAPNLWGLEDYSGEDTGSGTRADAGLDGGLARDASAPPDVFVPGVPPSRDASVVPFDAAPLFDAGPSGDASPILFSDAGSMACVTASPCGSQGELLQRGSTPYGTPRLSSLSVAYVVGLTSATVVRIEGTLNGGPFSLTVPLPATSDAMGNTSAAVPAGSYSSTRAAFAWLSTTGSCTSRQLPQLTSIEAHTAGATPREGEAIRIRGTLRIREQGWDLAIGFRADTACGTSITL